MSKPYAYETLKVSSPSDGVLHVELNRPNKLNTMNQKFWQECRECFTQIGHDNTCRVVVLSAAGRMFTAGLDLADFAAVVGGSSDDVARNSYAFLKVVRMFQESFTAIERIPQPVIAAVHGACIGGGVDMITACDIRICTEDAWFSIKEIDIGIVADVGTLQRLPKIIGNQSAVRELVYTGRPLPSKEAAQLGLVSRVSANKEAMMKAAFELAQTIAEKSPLAIMGCKEMLNYTRDHTVEDGLRYVGVWNAGFIQTQDVTEAAMAGREKRKPVFAKL